MSGPLDMDAVGAIYAYDGSFGEVGEVLCLIGGTWKKVWGALDTLSASISAGCYGAGSSGSSIPVTTNVVSVTVAGGSAPYTYAWARDDAGAPSWTINNPTDDSSSFTVTVAASGIETAEFECTVTDADGATVTTNLTYASAENYGGS
ncbi:MAG: hypothetical protein V4696_07445 [Pseudomonadota bacterium]